MKINLQDEITALPGVGQQTEVRLKKLGINTIEDLLLHVPSRYLDLSVKSSIANVQVGEKVTIEGKVVQFKNIFTRYGKNIQEAIISDNTAQIHAIWFNQSYLSKSIKEGEYFSVAGKVSLWNKKPAIIAPQVEKIKNDIQTIHTGRLVPIYPETSKLTSKWLRAKISDLLKESIVEEFLPDEILNKYSLMELSQAYDHIHFPKDLENTIRARKRLAFNELLINHIAALERKILWREKTKGKVLKVDSTLNDFINSLGFPLTVSQERSIEEITRDMISGNAMNRLLEGDVGSGKTVVAASAMFIAFTNGFQSILMAPTQILAEQHYYTLQKIFSPFKVRISLVTSNKIEKDPGKVDCLVGTHALLHKDLELEDVALVVIDEQHRFGVGQREMLVNIATKREIPHVLTMTATPIPRTIALTIYADLDLSTLDELPSGRKPITTWVVPENKRDNAYIWLEKEIKKTLSQAFVVCPLIEESETLDSVKAATVEYERLIKLMPHLSIGLLHGRQNAKAKSETLKKFREGEYQILVTTPVVEVGVDIPNATIMVIEGAERFGLAQLHQLRGRIGRGQKKSYCLLMSTKDASKRLSALKTSASGHELAEIDLKLRGPGELFGKRQHGFDTLRIADWQDSTLIRQSKELAHTVISSSNHFERLYQYLNSKKVVTH